MNDRVAELAPHRVAFRGEVDSGPLCYEPDDLVLLDPAGAALVPPHPADRTVHIEYPPRLATAESLARRLSRFHPSRLVAAGDGATLDVAKQAWLVAGTGATLVLAPVGAEPWRAFAPFTSLYGPDGRRVSRPDPSLATARVVVDPVALDRRPDQVTALHRADSAVHAVELLLNTRARSWQQVLARAGLAALERGVAGEDVAGAGLITEAFASAGLGLAHAVASPLAARAERTHDSVNVIVAPYVVRHWGTRADWSMVAGVLDTAATAAGVAGSLAARRARAGLPGSLAAVGFSRAEVQAVVPLALRSSGIPWLPTPVTAAEVTELLERAWSGQ